MVGDEDEAVRAAQVERVLAGTIGGERVAVPRHRGELGERGRKLELGDAPLQNLPLVSAKPALAGLVGGAGLLQFAVRPPDVDDVAPLHAITLGVIRYCIMATTSPLIQIPLVKPDLRELLPTDTGHYVAALLNRSGELNALRHVPDSEWARLTPMITVVGPKTPKAVLTPTSVSDWVKRLYNAVGTHAFFLDIERLRPSHPVGTDGENTPVLPTIYAQARKRQMQFVPVIVAGESPARPSHGCRGRGARGRSWRRPPIPGAAVHAPRGAEPEGLSEGPARRCWLRGRKQRPDRRPRIHRRGRPRSSRTMS